MNTINADTRLYGLIGDPVSKSLSPFIHNYVYEKENLNLSYMAFRVSANDLERGISGMKILGVNGFNATIPHKIELIDLVDELDPYAKQLQAVNTVKIKDGKLLGFNTDGPGLIRSLIDHDVDIFNAHILVIGAGGAARGIAMALGIHGCSSIGILNRTREKAEVLAHMITQVDTATIGIVESLENDLTKYNVVINTTSVGMYPYINEVPIELNLLSKDATLYDIVYKPHTTQFLKDGKKRGNKVIHGIEMLIYQALIADEIWLEKELDKRELKNELVLLAQEKGLLK